VAAAIGLGASALGYGYEDGTRWLGDASAALVGFVNAHVPTLVTVPYPWPLVLGGIPAGLGYYWFHRLQHTWRPLWLLTHRTHHVPTHLTLVTTTPAADPLGFVLAPVVQGVLIGASTKLFALEPMMFEALAWTIVTWTIPEVFNHNEPTYRWTMRGRFKHFWFHFLGSGAYHLVHHSSAEEHRLANLGGGPFMLWDRVFGTYYAPPEEVPEMGLTGRPKLWMNVFRLGLAGYLEIWTDLRRNHALKDRLMILFGPVSWSPPLASNFLTKPG
jgi:sterol desaturase/sphingolipid hydroxylase (fatty acid hydroxylase superfamily)